MTRIGVIGAGQAGTYHARAIFASRRATVAWVADPDRSRGEPLAAECGARYLADYNPGLGDIDATSVCTPHHLLAGVAAVAARAGKHLLLEKPMATSLVDADRVLRETRAAGVVLMVGFVHRYRPEVRRAAQLLAAGAIGTPQFLIDRAVNNDAATWPSWVRRAETGGGLLLYAGVHRIDRARWLLGREVRTVYGSTASLVSGIDADTSSSALLACDAGARAALAQHVHAMNVPVSWETDVHGTDGFLRIRTGAGIEITDRAGTRHEASGPDRRFEDEIASFLDAIDGAPAAIPTGEDGRAVLAVALAIMESSRTGQAVHLDHTPPARDR